VKKLFDSGSDSDDYKGGKGTNKKKKRVSVDAHMVRSDNDDEFDSDVIIDEDEEEVRNIKICK
jgi:hypothetical protein